MNTEELRAQLAGLEETTTKDDSGSGLFKSAADYGYGKTFQLFIKIQPEHKAESDPATFKIGDRDARYKERQALPAFRYPAPGQPLTREIEAAELQYYVTREIAGSHLRDSIRYVAECDLLGHTPGLSGFEAMRSEKWGYLLGLWASHQIAPPSEKQMQEWAQELIVQWKSESASLSEV